MHYKKCSFLARRKMSIAELNAYYNAERKWRYHHSEKIPGIRIRAWYHGALVVLLKLSRKANHQELRILSDKRRKTDKPVIYACTHIGFSDVAIAFESIRDACWILMGNPDSLFHTFHFHLLNINGVVYIDEFDKDDRMIAKATCIRLLEQGGSLLIYPEGAWNISPNQVVTPLFSGAIDMALKTGAEIVPIGMEQYGRTFLVNIGENLDICGMDRDKAELVRDLRDCMCTLKWEIWEKKPVEKRESLPEYYHKIFCRQILDEAGEGYSQKLVEEDTFHDRSAMEQCQVARELRRIVPSKANCYLFDKRNSGKVVSEKGWI